MIDDADMLTVKQVMSTYGLLVWAARDDTLFAWNGFRTFSRFKKVAPDHYTLEGRRGADAEVPDCHEAREMAMDWYEEECP